MGSHFDVLGCFGIFEKCAVFVFHLYLSFTFLGIFVESCFFLPAQNQQKQQPINNTESGGQRVGVEFGISSIASSSLGDRKKGYPKLQASWEKIEILVLVLMSPKLEAHTHRVIMSSCSK